MKIAIAADHAGFRLKEKIIDRLRKAGHEISDHGTNSLKSVDYPRFAMVAADQVARGEAERGILICGTGLGMCIAANKVKGIRAVSPADVFQAEMSRRHNDANILCLGERCVEEGAAFEILDIWLAAPFDAGRHAGRVNLITDLEEK